MAFQPVPNVVQAALVFVRGGKEIVNTFHAEFTTGYGQGDVDEVTAMLDTLMSTTWLPLLPTSIAYARTEARGLSVENDLFSENATSAAAGATGDTEYAPPQVTLAVRKTSNFTGRSARGRVFWPGFATNQLEGTLNTFVSVALRGQLLSAVDAVRTGLEGLTSTPEAVIVSRYTDGTQRPTGVTFRWTGSSVTDWRVDTQRRRLPAGSGE